MRIRALQLLAFVPPLALAACCDDSACLSSVELTVSEPGGARGSDYRFDAVVDGVAWTIHCTRVGAGACATTADPPRASAFASSVVGSEAIVLRLESRRPGAPIPLAVTVDGVSRAEQVVMPVAEPIRLHGPTCGPSCERGIATVALP